MKYYFYHFEFAIFTLVSIGLSLDKKMSGKSKDEQMAEKKQELEKRLQDVTGQLGNVKKAGKKGKFCQYRQLSFSLFQKRENY